jgi:hypothetical protein
LRRGILEQDDLGLGRGLHESQELPGVQRFARRLKLGLERMFAGELADDRRLPGIVPGQSKRTVRELLAVRNIQSRLQRWRPAELVGPKVCVISTILV